MLWVAARASSVLEKKYLCLQILYLFLDRFQLPEGDHSDADVGLSLIAPDSESKGYEGQIMTTRRS